MWIWGEALCLKLWVRVCLYLEHGKRLVEERASKKRVQVDTIGLVPVDDFLFVYCVYICTLHATKVKVGVADIIEAEHNVTHSRFGDEVLIARGTLVQYISG